MNGRHGRHGRHGIYGRSGRYEKLSQKDHDMAYSKFDFKPKNYKRRGAFGELCRRWTLKTFPSDKERAADFLDTLGDQLWPSIEKRRFHLRVSSMESRNRSLAFPGNAPLLELCLAKQLNSSKGILIR